MKNAYVPNGVVVQFLDIPENARIEDSYHPDLLAHVVGAPDQVEIGWVYDGSTFGPPAEPSVDLIAYAADLRWRREVGGITLDGVPVATDDRSKMMILGARVAASADPAWQTVWQGSDGNAYPVDAATMIAISDAVQDHVNRTFATFAAVKSGIEAGTITAPTEIDATFVV